MDSLLKQTLKEIEIIVVDDGSKDNSGAMADEYAEKNGNVKIVHQQNGGLSAARNTGIEKSEGKYIAFVDSDDYVEEDMMEVLYVEAEKYDADMTICNYYRDNIAKAAKVELRGFDKAGVYNGNEALKMFLSRKLSGHAWNKLYKKSIFNEKGIRFPKNRLYEDFPTTASFLMNSNRVVCVEKSLYYYVQRAGSITDKQSMKGITDTIKGAMDVYHLVKQERPEMESLAAFYLRTNAIDCKVMESKMSGRTKEQKIVKHNAQIQISQLWRYAKGKIHLKNAGGYYKICWLIYKLGLLTYVIRIKDYLQKN